MLRKIIRVIEYLLVPILFALYSISALTAHNIHEINIQDTFRAFLVAIFCVNLLFILIWLIVRDGDRSALIVFMAVILFFSYGHVREFMKFMTFSAPVLGRHRYLLTLFVILFIGWSWFILKRISSASLWSRRIRLIGAVLLIIPVFTIIGSFFPGGWGSSLKDNQAGNKTEDLLDESPDIYYIILDGYGRGDILEELYSFDNSKFLRLLEERGFYTAGESLSNYNTTRLSLASSLNLNYLQSFVESDGISIDPITAELMLRENDLSMQLKRFGYETVAFDSGRPWSSIDNADHYFEVFEDQSISEVMERTTILNLFETMLIETTFLNLLSDHTDIFKEFERSESAVANEEHRTRILYSLEKIQEVPRWQGNYFTFLHVLSPHPPFIFGASGERKDYDRPFTFGDGNNFLKIGSREEYIDGYTDQLQYINKLVIEVVDEILETSSSPPIIVIQGDHGPGAYLNWQSIEDSNLLERHGILNAYYFPNEKTKGLYPSISPVNSFRVILNTFFNGEYEMLEDRAFFTEKNGGYHLVDVTGIVN